MYFWNLQFSQKTNEKIRLYYYGTSSWIVFVRFLGELKTPKRHFEIDWPLACKSKTDQNIFLNYSFFEIQPLTFLTPIFWQIAGVKALCLITISYILHCQSKNKTVKITELVCLVGYLVWALRTMISYYYYFLFLTESLFSTWLSSNEDNHGKWHSVRNSIMSVQEKKRGEHLGYVLNLSI